MPVLTFDIDRERRDLDVAEEIALYEPDMNQWAVILMRARKLPTETAEFIWYDDDILISWTRVNNAGGYGSGDTQIVVEDVVAFAPKDLIKVPRTGEVMFVTAVNRDTSTVTVIRGYGGTTPDDLNHQDWLFRLSNAMEEYSTAPEPKVGQPTKFYNYTQTLRTPFDESDDSSVEPKKAGGSERNRLRQVKAIDHRLEIERTSLFGVRYEDVLNKRRTTGGLEFFIKTNVFDFTSASGVMTESDFNKVVLEPVYAKGNPQRKLFVASPLLFGIVNSWAGSRIETSSGEETYGLRLRIYKSWYGDLPIVMSRALEHVYATWGFVLDMDHIFYRPLRGRDTKLHTNIQENDRDGWKDEYSTKFGMMVRLEKAHAIIKGVQSGFAA